MTMNAAAVGLKAKLQKLFHIKNLLWWQQKGILGLRDLSRESLGRSMSGWCIWLQAARWSLAGRVRLSGCQLSEKYEWQSGPAQKPSPLLVIFILFFLGLYVKAQYFGFQIQVCSLFQGTVSNQHQHQELFLN